MLLMSWEKEQFTVAVDMLSLAIPRRQWAPEETNFEL
jgi:hypothetical protein